MDIQLVRNDRQVLEVKAKPETFLVIFISIWFLGFAGVPLISLPWLGFNLVYNLGTKTLSCQRNNNKIICQQKEDKLLGLAAPNVVELSQFKQAKFNNYKSPKGETINWLTLVTNNNREITIFSTKWEQRGFSSDEQTIQSWVNQINIFLASNQQSLTLEYPVREQWSSLLVLVFLTGFPVIGLTVIFLMLQIHNFTFERITQKITYRNSTLLGSKIKTYDWQIIQSLELRKKRGSKGSVYYELKYLTNDSTKLPSLVATKLNPLQEITQQMGEFLGVMVNDYSDRFS